MYAEDVKSEFLLQGICLTNHKFVLIPKPQVLYLLVLIYIKFDMFSVLAINTNKYTSRIVYYENTQVLIIVLVKCLFFL